MRLSESLRPSSRVSKRVDGRLSLAAPETDHGAGAGKPQETEGVLNPGASRGLDQDEA